MKYLLSFLLSPALVFGQDVLVKDYPGGVASFQALGALGAGTNSIFEYTISSNVAVAATTIYLDRTATLPAARAGVIAIGFGTTNLELRAVNTVSGDSLALNGALRFPHAASERVVYFYGPAYTAWWGCKADGSTDDAYALQQAVAECGEAGVTLRGAVSSASTIHQTSWPITMFGSLTAENLYVRAGDAFPEGGSATNTAILMNSAGERLNFVADAATDTLTFTSWSQPPTNSQITVYGLTNALPAPLSNGWVYFVETTTPTTVRLKAATNSASVIDITADGTGTAYSKVKYQGRTYLRNITVDGNAKFVNGVRVSMQQPAIWDTVFIKGCRRTGGEIEGFHFVMNNCLVLQCGLAWDFRNMRYLEMTGTLNPEYCTNGMLLSVGPFFFKGSTHAEFLGDTVNPNTNAGSLFIVEADTPVAEVPFVSVSGMYYNDSGPKKVFDFRSTNAPVSYNLSEIILPISVADDGLIAIYDAYRRYTNYAYTTNMALISCNRYIERHSAGPIPSTPILNTRGMGKRQVGFDNEFSNIGDPTGPWAVFQSGVGKIFDQWQFRRSDGTTNMGFNANGSLSARQGPNARAGLVTLVAGTITTNNTSVTANTLVVLTRKTSGGTIGTAITYTISAGVSLTVSSDNPLDTSTFSYLLIENPTP